jgi:hypothetical protein
MFRWHFQCCHAQVHQQVQKTVDPGNPQHLHGGTLSDSDSALSAGTALQSARQSFVEQNPTGLWNIRDQALR